MFTSGEYGLNKQLLIYGNILIDNEERLEILKMSLPGWLDFWDKPCLLRIRGKLAKEAASFASEFKNVTVKVDSTFFQWRFQSYCDLKTIGFKYVVIYLEDHLIISDKVLAPFILEDIDRMSTDIYQYSWFNHYTPLRLRLAVQESESLKLGTFIKLDKEILYSLPEAEHIYLCSLSSIFRRSFLLKLLRSSRPWIRKYDPKSPFDVEQAPRSTWYLPINFGLPNFELAACIDDDNGVEGYSLVSRGIMTKEFSTRGSSHHPRFSFFTFVKKLRVYLAKHWILESNAHILRQTLLNILNFATVIHYSIYAILLRLLDRIRYDNNCTRDSGEERE